MSEAATQAVETTGVFGAGKAAIARRWISELSLSERFWKPYWDRCKLILDRYEDERKQEQVPPKRKYAIFWSNIETLKPACYAKVPQAIVLRRYKDSDKVGRYASEVLERAINYSLDAYDFDQVLKDIRDEFLILAKGQSWARYVPTFEDVEQTPGVDVEDAAKPLNLGDEIQASLEQAAAQIAPETPADQPAQTLSYEEVLCDHVCYDDWGTNRARNWAEVRFVWRRVYMNREALIKRFGKKIGNAVPLDWKDPNKSDDAEAEQFAQAMVYEIWDRVSRKAIWISKSFNASPLDERSDPLGLKDFFPCPKPALGTMSPRSLVPIPDYAMYQDQAEELDELTERIAVLTKALRMVGIYAGEDKDTLQNVFRPGRENELIPIDNWAEIANRGGIRGIVEWVPIEQVIKVLTGLYDARDRVVAVIYQICAISDIMRGDTDPNETAAAQGLKSTWGSSRVREKQKEMARLCRDIMRLKGEIIASKFSVDTLKQMTNVQLLTQAEKQAIQAKLDAYEAAKASYEALQAQLAQQQPQAPAQPGAAPVAPPTPQLPPPQPPIIPPDVMAMMQEPTWDEVDALLKSDALRLFRIDIEADSTVEPDLNNDKQQAVEYLTAMTGFFAAAGPIVQMQPKTAQLFGEIAKFANRRFQAGREVETVFEQTMDGLAQMEPPPPEQAKAGKSPEELALEAQKVQVAREGNQIKLKQVEADAQNSAFDAQTNAASVQAENKRTDMEAWMRQQDQRMEQVLAFMEAQTRRYEADADERARGVEAEAAKAAAAAKARNGNGASA